MTDSNSEDLRFKGGAGPPSSANNLAYCITLFAHSVKRINAGTTETTTESASKPDEEEEEEEAAAATKEEKEEEDLNSLFHLHVGVWLEAVDPHHRYFTCSYAV